LLAFVLVYCTTWLILKIEGFLQQQAVRHAWTLGTAKLVTIIALRIATFFDCKLPAISERRW
jgi:hypothetical protein